ncbi:DNA alkylation repair protein [Rapidithrix thailandica]|uniref:DNA alkylation repair protein n=1 Tax=Rapidithrix thailandica TaxID=413964 RepID=A0AAW9S8P8_9BACT
MTTQEVLQELALYGSEQTKKVFRKHGAREPFYGVKVADLRKLQKKLKKNSQLAEELYNTGNSDAMYLAGLIADPSLMSKEQLQRWVDKAYWYMLSEHTVANVTADSPWGYELALKWIKADKEQVVAAGWATLSGIVSVKEDETLNLSVLKQLLQRVEKDIHQAPNRVRYTMNNFVIALGCYVSGLTEMAKKTAGKIGAVHVNMGETACKVPQALAYIEKVEGMNRIGKKRKSAQGN